VERPTGAAAGGNGLQRAIERLDTAALAASFAILYDETIEILLLRGLQSAQVDAAGGHDRSGRHRGQR
jgi:hypothetical protein